jgi:hypothetical protein
VEAMVTGAPQTPRITKLDAWRDESIARVAPCPVAGPGASNANALALARQLAPRDNKRRGILVGCPAPIAVLGGDLARAGVARSLLDIAPITPPAVQAVVDDDAPYDGAKFAEADRVSIFVLTRSSVARDVDAFVHQKRSDDDVVWLVRMPTDAAADLFANAVAMRDDSRARDVRVMRAPRRYVVLRGPRSFDDEIVTLVERLADIQPVKP